MLQTQVIDVPVNAAIDTKRDDKLTDANAFVAQENSRFYKSGAIVKRNGFNRMDTGLPVDANRKRLITDNEQLFLTKGGGTNQTQSFLDDWRQLGDSSIFTSVNGTQLKALEYFGGQGSCLTGWVDYYDGKYLVVANQSYPASARLEDYPSFFVYDGENHRSSGVGFTALGASDLFTGAKGVWIDSNGSKYAVFSAALESSSTSYASILVLDESLQTVIFETQIALGYLLLVPGEVSICRGTNDGFATIVVKNGADTAYIAEVNESGIINSDTVTFSENIYGVGDVVTLNGTHTIAAYKGSDDYPIFLNVDQSTFASNWEVVGSDGTMSLGTIGSSARLSIWAGASLQFALTTREAGTNINQMSVWGLSSGGVSLVASDYNVANMGRGVSGVYIPVEPNWTNGPTGVSNIKTVGIAYASGGELIYIGSGFFDRHYSSSTSSFRTSLVETSTGIYSFIVLEPLRTEVRNGVATLSSRATLAQFDINNSDQQYGNSVNIGDSLLSMDGMPTILDGQVQRPAGFYFRPWISATGSTTGGSLPAGTYRLQGHFSYTDAQGNQVLSPISNELEITTTGTTSSIAVKIHTSRWLGTVNFTLFMNLSGGATLYQKDKVSIDPTAENTSMAVVSIVDNTFPQIYTTGNVLENDPPPPCLHSSVHNDRIWYIPADEKNKLGYTNKYISGEVPSFSNDLFIQQASSDPSIRDELVASGPVGNKQVILRERSVYYVAGDGANLIGEQSTLTEPELISRDIGCSNAKSVISTPIGLFFKSPKGIYLVGGGMSIEYIGAPVEAYNSEQIIDSALIAENNIVIFATPSRLLVYDYYLQRWAVDTIANIRSIAVWSDDLVILKTDGSISKQSTSFTDNFLLNSDGISMKVITGWLKLTSVQGFARIKRMFVLGKWKSAHTLKVKAYYNYDDTYSETFTFNNTTAPDLYEFECHLRKQKCESVKFEIYDDAPTGESMELSMLSLQVGAKSGAYKNKPARQD